VKIEAAIGFGEAPVISRAIYDISLPELGKLQKTGKKKREREREARRAANYSGEMFVPRRP